MRNSFEIDYDDFTFTLAQQDVKASSEKDTSDTNVAARGEEFSYGTEALSSVPNISCYGDIADGPVFALRHGIKPNGDTVQVGIYSSSALLFAQTRDCKQAEFKRFPSVIEAETWLRQKLSA